MRSLDTPMYRAEAMAQDLHPANMQELQGAMADRRHQSPMQQRVLGDELKRIQGIQTKHIQQALQALPQKLTKDLSPSKTGEQWPTPEASIVRMMLQMQRRYPGMRRGPAPSQPF